MKKVLLNENVMRSSQIIDNAKDSAKMINQTLIPSLDTIGVKITNEVLTDLFSGKNQTLRNYEDAVLQDLSMIKTPALKQANQLIADQCWEQFETILSKVRHDSRNYELLTIENDVCLLTAANEELIRENGRIYLTAPEDIERHNDLNMVCQLLNKTFKGSVPLAWWARFQEGADGLIHRTETL